MNRYLGILPVLKPIAVMTETHFSNYNYVEFLHAIAANHNIQPINNFLTIPKKMGKGFIAAFAFADGLSVLITDNIFYEEQTMHRVASPAHQYYILQFNESLNDNNEGNGKKAAQHHYDAAQNAILLTSSLMDTKFLYPANTRIRSVKIIFGNDYLPNLIGSEVADKFLSNYFSMILKSRNIEFIDSDYRHLMDELIKENIDHPLRLNFIRTRIMLLIEKLIIGFIAKLEKNKQAIKMKDDEIARLIKVESVLVKNYSGPPPNITALAKVAAMSPTKLKKDFKTIYGLPIYVYYQKNRMMRAKTLLLQDEYAIKEVGMMIGYTNLGHFAGSFKKEFGVLPSELLQQKETKKLEPSSHVRL